MFWDFLWKLWQILAIGVAVVVLLYSLFTENVRFRFWPKGIPKEQYLPAGPIAFWCLAFTGFIRFICYLTLYGLTKIGWILTWLLVSTTTLHFYTATEKRRPIQVMMGLVIVALMVSLLIPNPKTSTNYFLLFPPAIPPVGSLRPTYEMAFAFPKKPHCESAKAIFKKYGAFPDIGHDLRMTNHWGTHYIYRSSGGKVMMEFMGDVEIVDNTYKGVWVMTCKTGRVATGKFEIRNFYRDYKIGVGWWWFDEAEGVKLPLVFY